MCCLSQDDRKNIGYAMIDIRTGEIIQKFNFGSGWCHMQPLGKREFSGKILVESEGDAGIIDLTNPHIHEHCTVASIPSADSVEIAQSGVKFHRVSSGRLWTQLAEVCGHPIFDLDSQVVKEANVDNERHRQV